jgi:hypothetical protein
MMNKFSVVQLGIPDDIISISILAKLSREYWNIVDNIILNKSIVFFPSQTLKKLQELVFMKDICSNNFISSATKSESKTVGTKEDSATAFKADSLKKRPKTKNENPCSIGSHNPKATHPEWKCFKLTDEERIAAGPPGKGATHLTASHNQEPESDYVEVSAFVSLGPELN